MTVLDKIDAKLDQIRRILIYVVLIMILDDVTKYLDELDSIYDNASGVLVSHDGPVKG